MDVRNDCCHICSIYNIPYAQVYLICTILYIPYVDLVHRSLYSDGIYFSTDSRIDPTSTWHLAASTRTPATGVRPPARKEAHFTSASGCRLYTSLSLTSILRPSQYPSATDRRDIGLLLHHQHLDTNLQPRFQLLPHRPRSPRSRALVRAQASAED